VSREGIGMEEFAGMDVVAEEEEVSAMGLGGV
jgi:hypothetical protein